MRKFIIILLVCTLFAGGCAKYNKVEIQEISVKNFSADIPKATLSFTLNTQINNPNKKKIEILASNGEVFKDGVHFADIFITEKYTVIKGESTIPLKINVKATDPLALLAIGFDYKNIKLSDFTINFEATIKSGIIKKTFKFNDIPLNELSSRVQNILQ